RTASAGDRRHRVVSDQGFAGRLAADLGDLSKIMLAGEDAGATGPHAIAQRTPEHGPLVGIVEPPGEGDRQECSAVLDPFGEAIDPRSFMPFGAHLASASSSNPRRIRPPIPERSGAIS